jgi:hypothetical protein
MRSDDFQLFGNVKIRKEPCSGGVVIVEPEPITSGIEVVVDKTKGELDITLPREVVEAIVDMVMAVPEEDGGPREIMGWAVRIQ